MELQKRWNTPEIKVITALYSICHSSPLTGSFNCETVLIIKMSIKAFWENFRNLMFGKTHSLKNVLICTVSMKLKIVFECAR